MADFHFQRDTNRFFCLGLDLNRPVDSVKELHYPRLVNVRTYQIGRLEPRFGLTLIGNRMDGPVHSIRRLNVSRISTWTRVIGSGSKLNTGQTTFTEIDSGYSGDPLALVPYRPAESADPWMYVMDSQRQRKVNVASTLHQVGLPPPTTAPTVTRDRPCFKSLFTQPMSTAGWSITPPFVATFPGTVLRVGTTISEILYDTGNTGWCSIYPSSIANVGEGMDLLVNGSELVQVHDVRPGNSTSTTIANIKFVSGADGKCFIVLATNLTGVADNVLLSNTSDGTQARIEAVIQAEDESWSVICTTPAGSTWVNGDTVFLRPTIRTWTAGTFTAGNTLANTSLQFHCNNTADSPELGLTGHFWYSAQFGPPVDLTEIATGVHSGPDDYIHISMAFSDPQNVATVKVIFFCTPLISHDYFFKEFAPSDLIVSAPEVGGTGGAWGELRFKIADLLKAGNPTLQHVYSVQIDVTLNVPITSSPILGTEVSFGSIIMRGGFGPDTGVGSNYIYRYRARCSSTGVVSNWGPATRESFYLVREKAEIVAPAQYTLATEADYLDIQRKGGPIVIDDAGNAIWNTIGSVLNSAGPVTFTDKIPDDVAAVLASEDQIHYQLWPVLGAPVTGTTTSVCGPIVETGGGNPFNLAWAPQTPIQINGVFYTIYRVNSVTQLELFENAGNQTTVAWIVAEPVLQAQTFPCYWGPLAETFFGVGDPVNPQRLYWTNTGSADDTQLKNWKDITTPSEPLMNGVIYNGRSYVWSSERLFHLLPGGTDEAGNVTDWNPVEIPNGKGLFAKWCYTGLQTPAGLILYWLAREGIYRTDGGGPDSITDETMRPLFPNEGNLGERTNDYDPPNVVQAVAPYHRLAYTDDYLYYDYPDTSTVAGHIHYKQPSEALLDGVTLTDRVQVNLKEVIFRRQMSDSFAPSDSVTINLITRVLPAHPVDSFAPDDTVVIYLP